MQKFDEPWRWNEDCFKSKRRPKDQTENWYVCDFERKNTFPSTKLVQISLLRDRMTRMMPFFFSLCSSDVWFPEQIFLRANGLVRKVWLEPLLNEVCMRSVPSSQHFYPQDEPLTSAPGFNYSRTFFSQRPSKGMDCNSIFKRLINQRTDRPTVGIHHRSKSRLKWTWISSFCGVERDLRVQRPMFCTSP